MIRAAAVRLPVALLAGATAADLLGVAADAPALWIVGAFLELAGLLGAALSLVARGVLPGSRGSRRGPGRLLASVLALLLFAAAWWVRGDASIPPDPAILLIEPVALALLVLGEWRPLRPGAPDPERPDRGA